MSVRSYYKRTLRARLLGIGTIIGKGLLRPRQSLYRTCMYRLLPPIHVFSSGISGDWSSCGVAPLRRMIFHAVRGELTREQVIKLGLLEPDADVTLGDAGILAPFLLDNMPPKRYFCGIVPHVADYGLPCVVRTQDKIRNSVVINVREDPLKVLEQMASCEMILASAMHGLIVADALGIPNQWVRFSDNPQIGGFGDRFKYHDYYSIFPGYPHEPIKPDAVMKSFIPERFITQFNPRTEIVRMTQQSLLECAGKMKEVLG